MICSLYGHLSVQYAETTNGVLPVQVRLSVHSLSCGRLLCLPQVRIIFSHFPYIRAGIPRISAHYAEAIMDAICSSQIFGHSYSLTLSDCTDILSVHHAEANGILSGRVGPSAENSLLPL